MCIAMIFDFALAVLLRHIFYCSAVCAGGAALILSTALITFHLIPVFTYLRVDIYVRVESLVDMLSTEGGGNIEGRPHCSVCHS